MIIVRSPLRIFILVEVQTYQVGMRIISRGAVIASAINKYSYKYKIFRQVL